MMKTQESPAVPPVRPTRHTTCTPAPEDDPRRQLLTALEVAQRLRMGQRTFFRLVAAGKFPPPLRQGRKWSRWKTADVEHYLDQLEAQRDGRRPHPPR